MVVELELEVRSRLGLDREDMAHKRQRRNVTEEIELKRDRVKESTKREQRERTERRKDSKRGGKKNE